MLIEGTHTLQAQPDEVWQVLTRPETLRQTFPGIEHIERRAGDMYHVTLHIQHGPFKGQHTVCLAFAQQSYPEQFQLTLESEDADTFKAICTVDLQERAQKTIITYRSNLTVHNMSAVRLVKGALKLLIQQYFLGLTDLLYAQDQTHSAQTASDPIILQQARGNIAILPQSRAEKQGASRWNTWSSRLTGLLWREPAQKELWIKRIRRYGTIGSLLLLVWVGTRIPRR